MSSLNMTISILRINLIDIFDNKFDKIYGKGYGEI